MNIAYHLKWLFPYFNIKIKNLDSKETKSQNQIKAEKSQNEQGTTSRNKS